MSARFATGLSRHPKAAVAVAEAVGDVLDRLSGPPSLAVLFVSGRHVEVLSDIVDTIHALLCPDVLIGTSANGVVGGADEIEGSDALSLWAATGIDVTPLRLEALPGTVPLFAGLPERLAPASTMVVLADPMTMPTERLLDTVDERYDRVELVGGVASAPGKNLLVLNQRILDGGAVGFTLAPGVARAIVSQGCRPIGTPWVVTEAGSGLLRQLGGRPALGRLSELIEGLSPEDRLAAAGGLHVGVVANELKTDFGQGDFLIRAVLGGERSTGSVAVDYEIDVGQLVQFQVRDANSAGDELTRLLGPVRGDGALVFTCVGRGSHMFEGTDHDTARVSEVIGAAVAGMFCDGELGPIGARNALHTFTATVLIFG